MIHDIFGKLPDTPLDDRSPHVHLIAHRCGDTTQMRRCSARAADVTCPRCIRFIIEEVSAGAA